MASPRQTDEPVCPVARAARLLGDHWTLLILRDLEHGCRRFHELEESTGMSPGVLSGRLRHMERAGIVSRRQYNEIPPRLEHAWTETGGPAVPPAARLRAYGGRGPSEDPPAATDLAEHATT